MRSAAEPIRPRLAAAAALLAIAAGALLPAPAPAATTGRVCVARAAVLNSPGGFAVGYLYRGDRVRIVRRTASRVWIRMNTARELRGWMRARSVCRR